MNRVPAAVVPAAHGSWTREPAGWRADPYTAALTTGQGPLYLRSREGGVVPLGVERWCAAPDAADRTVIARCEGTVLDIGCGPGRFVTALALAGYRTLGIDVSTAAVHRTVRHGGAALVRSVFEPLPREGWWNTALLVDGNIGIGGDPDALLTRTADVVAPGGLLIAEVADGDVDERLDVCVDDGRSDHTHGGHGPAGQGRARADDGGFFPWARLGARALVRHARATGRWSRQAAWELEGRTFVALRRKRERPAPSLPGPVPPPSG
ncbi:methyltransferase domain-containing protein [Streptomyces montanisoli]|uniref:Methyltransferase domain-containing protein n=1 Tax=Streptomyces montanisoli TaxID=2798581 RepID=A0A940M8N4_9ACTN|nr:methyltransferase domain-containing protein [Streptomyces montanisoli]MBP0458294.1 methyltransferase domain-containing protein [Streptomyces montanisoli]